MLLFQYTPISALKVDTFGEYCLCKLRVILTSWMRLVVYRGFLEGQGGGRQGGRRTWGCIQVSKGTTVVVALGKNSFWLELCTVRYHSGKVSVARLRSDLFRAWTPLLLLIEAGRMDLFVDIRPATVDTVMQALSGTAWVTRTRAWYNNILL